jgi:adenylate kinase family enzyme
MTGTFIIIRGIPGVGKTREAKIILDGVSDCCHADTDHHFEREDGVYRFDASQLSEPHHLCRQKVEDVMKGGVSLIVQSNTNTTQW